MKTIEIRKNLKEKFRQQNIDEVDVDFIIASVLNISHTELNLVDEISAEQIEKINEIASIRLTGKPLDKILGYKYFYGLKFEVNEYVLSPRQETEILVETALKYIKQENYKSVLDLCTGSGCLAVCIKRKTDAEVTATDVSLKALNVAKTNAYKNNANIKFVRSNMFEKIEGKFDLIVSNPPYIASDELKDLDDEVRLFDPLLALDGGELGLKFYNIIHDNAKKHLNDNGMLIMEIGDEQFDLINNLFNDFRLIETVKDYQGINRFVVFKK